MQKTRNNVLIWISLLISNCVVGQSFYANGKTITDYKNTFYVDSIPIVVKGLSNKIDKNFGLSKICFDVTHTKASDLKIELLSPNGQSIWLTNRNGGDVGGNYMSTCFRSNGFSGYVHRGKTPFIGEFIPDGRLSFINNGQNPNGVWYLLVQDLHKENVGKVNYATLEFSKNPMPNENQNPCTFEDAKACLSSQKNGELLPDLILLEKFTLTQIKEYPPNDPNYGGQLRFAASIANIGDGPMETFGKKEWFCGDNHADSTTICPNGKKPRQRLYQRVYQKKDTTLIFEDRVAGTNYFDDKPGHDHFHVDNWVEFSLLSRKKTFFGKYKYNKVANSSKVSYCLWDTGICNNSDSLCTWKKEVYGEKNLPNYGLGNYSECKSGKQGISVGGYDTYGMLYEGQFIQLPKNMRSGIYYLKIVIDPKGIYKEKNKANNTFVMPFSITKQQIE